MDIEDWERRHNESWVDRWYRLTKNAPKDASKLKITKQLNCGAATVCCTLITDDARSLRSMKFRSKTIE